MPEQRIERREEGRPERGRGGPTGARERRQIAREREPAAGRPLDRDLRDVASLEQTAERGAARARLEARECEVPGQIELRRRAHRVQGAREVPALELFRRDRLDAVRVRQRALQEVVTLLEVLPRVDRERSGHPQVVERVLDGPPRPPPTAAGRAPPLEV